MKKTHETVESLLESSKEAGLSVSERSDMWQELRTYADFHTPAPVAPRTIFSFANLMRFATATAAVVFVSVGTGYASYDSLPGEPLYAVKVHVVEPVVGFSHSSEQEQLTYQASLLERRLSEMHELLKSESLTEENVVALETQVAEHSDEISSIIEADLDASVTAEERLDVLGDVVTTLRTHKFIEDSKIGKGRPSKFASTEDSVSALFAVEVAKFADESPSEAVEYIADVVHELDDNLASAEVASSTVGEITEYLEDAEEALSEGDVDKALQYTGEAKRVIDFDKNIDAVLEIGEEQN